MARRRDRAILASVVLCLAAAGWALVRREEARPLAWEPVGARTREEKIRDHLFWSLQPVKVTNCELKRFGEANDGGYILCGNLLGAVQRQDTGPGFQATTAGVATSPSSSAFPFIGPRSLRYSPAAVPRWADGLPS